jgi:ComF family protein
MMAGFTRPVAFASDGCAGDRRVVFSSTGDLVRTATEVRLDNPRNAFPIRAKRTLLRAMRSALDILAAVLLPSNCRVCERRLIRLTRIPVCDECIASLERAHVTACSICGEALDIGSREAQAICPLCRRAHPEFDFAMSFGAYQGALRKLIHLLKYEQLRPAANVLGARIASVIAERGLAGADPMLLIPVPLHRIKRRQRGFNQSELIAHSVWKHLERPGYVVHIGNLQRVRATVSQTGLTRHQRRENVRGAFAVKKAAEVRDRRVVLIDDVYTTGTTLNECARVLRKAGARDVIVATVARVYRENLRLKIVSSNRPGASLQTQEEHAAIRGVAG